MKTPFDELSYSALLFLAERTDFSEPFFGYGIATSVKVEIQKAYEKKLHERKEFLEKNPLSNGICTPVSELFQAKNVA